MRDYEGYYHICTDGMSRRLLFRDFEDYIRGMNDIPACISGSRLEILCFCLMPNHVHFIVYAAYSEAQRFIDEFKRRTSGRLVRKYNEVKPLLHLGTLIKNINSGQYLKTAIAYVLRNPLSGNIRCLPYNYKWSSANLYFRHMPSDGQGSEITVAKRKTGNNNVLRHEKMSQGITVATGHIRLADLTQRQIWKYTGTRSVFPGDYAIDRNGLILPESYINPEKTEKIYGSPKQFLYYLSKNDDGEFEISQGITNFISYDYSQIKEILGKLCISETGANDFTVLNIEDKCRIAILMKKRYGVSARQIARLTGLDPAILQSIMQ